MRFFWLAAFFLTACSTVTTGVRVLTHTPTQQASRVPSGLYQADPDHVAVLFRISHLGYSDFIARFDQVEATLDYDNQVPTASRLSVIIPVAGLDVIIQDLRAMLVGPDFFDADAHPTLRFVSSSIRLTGDNQGEIDGELSMAGATHSAVLDVTFNGAANNPLTGKPTLGFSATSQIDRSDWGLGNWRPAVADTVRIEIEAEFVKADQSSSQ